MSCGLRMFYRGTNLLYNSHEISTFTELNLLKMGYLSYKGYKGTVEYSEADRCLFGRVIGLAKATIIYEGKSIDELQKDFENGIESYLEGCKEDGVEPTKPL